MRRLRRAPEALANEVATHEGLAYALWLPDPAGRHDRPLRGGIVILHGAGSSKESHYDFARVAVAAGFAAIAFDQRGHGDSAGPMDGRVLADVASIAALLRHRAGMSEIPIALRGSSMGGYLAILAAPLAGAGAVIAICPASAEGLRRGLLSGAFDFDADRQSLDAFLAEHDLHAAVQALDVPLLLLHAEGDEQVPVEHSRELAAYARHPTSRLIALPGGHHRSIQHDEELQAVSVRFLERALTASASAP